jgi:hypothetical protein
LGFCFVCPAKKPFTQPSKFNEIKSENFRLKSFKVLMTQKITKKSVRKKFLQKMAKLFAESESGETLNESIW